MTLTGESRAAVPSIALNDENTMPVLGLGVAELSDDETERAVSAALEVGCRLIDTAAAYGNEAAVGRAIAASGIPRAELFVTTKLATPDQGFSSARGAVAASLERLGLDYVDLFLIHWPAPSLGKYPDAFGGLIQARGEGHTRSIGVANFTDDHLSTIIDLTFVTPAVNQIELHPLLNQDDTRKANAQHNVLTQSHTPLVLGRLTDNPTASPATWTSSISSWPRNTWMPSTVLTTAPACARTRTPTTARNPKDRLARRAGGGGPTQYARRSLVHRQRVTTQNGDELHGVLTRESRVRRHPLSGRRIALVLIGLAFHRQQVGRIIGET